MSKIGSRKILTALNNIRDITTEDGFSINVINEHLYEFGFREIIKKINHK